jgi:SAM-dependent methyltransferase
VFPIHADARQLPFAGEFFDAVLCIDAYNYFGTDDLYLNYLVHFLRPGGILAFVSAGLTDDFGSEVPTHLQRFWGADSWNIHSAAWWREHVAKTRLVEVLESGCIANGWELWLEWAQATDASAWYQEMLAVDRGRYLGYVGVIAKRIPGQPLAEYAWPSTLRSVEGEYQYHPVLRDETASTTKEADGAD